MRLLPASGLAVSVIRFDDAAVDSMGSVEVAFCSALFSRHCENSFLAAGRFNAGIVRDNLRINYQFVRRLRTASVSPIIMHGNINMARLPHLLPRDLSATVAGFGNSNWLTAP